MKSGVLRFLFDIVTRITEKRKKNPCSSRKQLDGADFDSVIRTGKKKRSIFAFFEV